MRSPQIDDRPRISIVVPVLNEEDNVGTLYAEIVESIADSSWELIFIDDGSTDETLSKLTDLAKRDDRVRVLKLSRNFGQTAALQAGFDAATGSFIVTLDGDLQNDPHDIPRLIDELEQGYDVVTGWRKDRKDKTVTRKLPSVIANWLIAKVSGVPLRDNGCALKAYRREVIDRTAIYSDMHRYLVPMMSLSGARIKETVVNHRPRRYGVSKYGLARIFSVSLDLLMLKMLLRFTSHPAAWFATLAFPFALLALIAVPATIFLSPISGTPLDTRIVLISIATLSTFASVHLILVGMVAELAVSLGDFREAESILQNVEVG